MTFVRRHIMLIIVLFAAIAAAVFTDFLAGPWAQQYASGNMDGLGWFMSPLVQNGNVIGSVATFLVLWTFCIAYIAVLLSPVLLKRQIAPVKD